jgi:hypothetical protein
MDTCPSDAEYFSLTYYADNGIVPAICYCYTALFYTTELHDNDNACFEFGGYQFGLLTSSGIYSPPSTEFVYHIPAPPAATTV